jgi:hypothetical protein
MCSFGLGRIIITFAFWEACFQEMKGRETLRRLHNDLNTTDNNVGLTDSFSTSIGLHITQTGFSHCFLNFYLFIYLLFYLCLVKVLCNESMNKAGLLFILYYVEV